MTTPGTQVDTAALAQASAKVEEEVATMARVIGLVDGRVGDAKAHWTGTSSARFQSLMGEYTEKSQKMHQSLIEIADALNGSAKNYDQTEEQIESTIAAQASSLPNLN